ncbi:MAG: polysaccharide deacetylase family protein [Bacteroidales bacterium]
MYFKKPPTILTQLTRNWLTWDMPSGDRKIYLTFDDGPVPEVTPEVLLILKMFGVKATFFCVGENVSKHPELFNEIKAAGHAVGNHTFNHLQAWKTPAGEYLRNVEASRQLINSSLFRPPHGQLTPWLIQQLRRKYQIIMWTVLTGDFDRTLSPGQCLENAIRHTQPGSIVVFHDSIKASRNMLYSLPLFLEHFKSMGAEFGTII